MTHPPAFPDALRLVATTRIIDWAHHDDQRDAFLFACLARHLQSDWGELDTEDWARNDQNVACRAGRLLSAYRVPGRLAPHDASVWVITDDIADLDTVTTILWPSDY